MNKIYGSTNWKIPRGVDDWVIGSPYAGITFSFEFARQIQAIHGFTEKDPNDPAGKKMLWRGIAIPPGTAVLQIEELITTLGTALEVKRAVKEGNQLLLPKGSISSLEFRPIIGALVHRPPKLPITYEGVKVVALINKAIWAKDPKDCPLCKEGSHRLRPKTHWKELTEGM